MANHNFQDQIDKSCSANNWDQGNDTHAPTDQAMSGGVSTVKQKCNAATNEMQEDDDMAETYSGNWQDSTVGGAGTSMDAGGYGRDGSQTMQGGGPEYTQNHDGPFYGGTDDPHTGGSTVQTGQNTDQTGSTGAAGARSEATGTGGAESRGPQGFDTTEDQGPDSPTMTGFSGDPADNGTVNSVQRDTVQGKAKGAADTVGEKAGGVMDGMKNSVEDFFNTDFDGDGQIGDGYFVTDERWDLQDPDALQDPELRTPATAETSYSRATAAVA